MGGNGEEEEDGDELRAGREEEAAGGEHEGGEGEVWDRVDLALVRGPKDSTSTSSGRNEIPKQLPIPVLISLKNLILPAKKVLFLADDLSSVVLGRHDSLFCNIIIDL